MGKDKKGIIEVGEIGGSLTWRDLNFQYRESVNHVVNLALIGDLGLCWQFMKRRKMVCSSVFSLIIEL